MHLIWSEKVSLLVEKVILIYREKGRCVKVQTFQLKKKKKKNLKLITKNYQ